MTPYTDFPARQPSPQASSATADLLLAACQRTFTLQAEWMDQMIHRGLDQSRQTAAESMADPSALAVAAMRGPWQQNALVEPLWRYLAGLMVVGRETTAAIMALTQAQMRGANDEVERLARQAHDEADRASRSAAAAAQAAGQAMTQGIAAAAAGLTDLTASGAATVERAATDTAARAADTVSDSTGTVPEAVGQAAGANGRSGPPRAPRAAPGEHDAAQQARDREPGARPRKPAAAAKKPARGRGAGRPRASR